MPVNLYLFYKKFSSELNYISCHDRTKRNQLSNHSRHLLSNDELHHLITMKKSFNLNARRRKRRKYSNNNNNRKHHLKAMYNHLLSRLHLRQQQHQHQQRLVLRWLLLKRMLIPNCIVFANNVTMKQSKISPVTF